MRILKWGQIFLKHIVNQTFLLKNRKLHICEVGRFLFLYFRHETQHSNVTAGNTKGGSITVPMTSRLTRLESAV
jgi:hypothetical protein